LLGEQKVKIQTQVCEALRSLSFSLVQLPVCLGIKSSRHSTDVTVEPSEHAEEAGMSRRGWWKRAHSMEASFLPT
jgi:hypothetical protein